MYSLCHPITTGEDKHEKELCKLPKITAAAYQGSKLRLEVSLQALTVTLSHKLHNGLGALIKII